MVLIGVVVEHLCELNIIIDRVVANSPGSIVVIVIGLGVGCVVLQVLLLLFLFHNNLIYLLGCFVVMIANLHRLLLQPL